MAVLLACFYNATVIYGRTHTADTTEIGFRRSVAARLQSQPGTHLVLVHYAPGHDANEELVHNDPDIDKQKIIWAFDFGPEADRPLLERYRDRKVWLALPDGPHPTLDPYSAAAAR